MKNYLLFKYIGIKIKEYIFLFLTATIILVTFEIKSFSEENIFIVDNVEVKGSIDINFNREKYIDKGLAKSYKILLSRILISKDISKIDSIKLKKIKNLISGFQIKNETYKNEEYKAYFRIIYNDNKVKQFLIKENISFSEPKNITAVFFPALFVNGELKNLSENYFFKNWAETKIKNQTINFILPLEDLDDLTNLKKIREGIETIDIENLAKKYNTDNYSFALMEYQNNKLNIYLRTNFNSNEISKNLNYKIFDINNKNELNLILKKVKMQISDIWKEQNIINLAIPLSVSIKYQHDKLKEVDNLKNVFYKISIIDNFSLTEFNIKNSIFKIYYYGNPKKLSNELLKFGYELKNDKGLWIINKKND